MRLSLAVNSGTSGADEDLERIDAVIRQVVRATEGGFHGVVLREVLVDNAGAYGDNLTLAAYLAGLTPPGASFVATLAAPIHNPPRLAQQINLLDIVCGGTLTVALSPGAGSPEAFEAYGRDAARREEDFAAIAELLPRLLAKKPDDAPIEWSTAYESGVVQARIMPAACERPAPLLARETVDDDDEIDWAGRNGWHLVASPPSAERAARVLERYRSALEQSDLDEEAVEARLDSVLFTLPVIIGATDAHAQASIDRLVAFRQKAGVMRPLGGSTISGDPGRVVAGLREWEAAGCRHLAVMVQIDHADDRELELFVREVLPAIDSAAATEARA